MYIHGVIIKVIDSLRQHSKMSNAISAVCRWQNLLELLNANRSIASKLRRRGRSMPKCLILPIIKLGVLGI